MNTSVLCVMTRDKPDIFWAKLWPTTEFYASELDQQALTVDDFTRVRICAVDCGLTRQTLVTETHAVAAKVSSDARRRGIVGNKSTSGMGRT